MEQAPTKETASYLESFERFEKQAQQPAWLHPLRQAGISSFREQGFPTLRDEDWRFTNVAPITRLPLQSVLEAPPDSTAVEALKQAPFKGLSGVRLVFVDGHFSAGLSTQRSLPAGVRVLNLAAALAGDPAFLEKHLGRYAQSQGNAFAALNQAFFMDGAFIHVPPGVEVADLIQLVFISSAGSAGAAVHPRNLIITEAGSRVTVVESYLSSRNGAYLTNVVTELIVGEDSRVELLKFQDEAGDAFHLATIHGQFGRASNVKVHSFALGARLSRTHIRATLAGEGLECILNGLYLTRNEQLADHHMIVEHAEPHCASHEYFNGILDDKSKGVFHGRIYVHQIAQKTDAKQTNKNLLLSDDATVDTKPQLEIYADDVKCTHGATVGQLNAEAIFYLRSRGLGVETARQMLIHAFAGEIIERVGCEPAREELDKIVWDRLENNLHLAKKK
ncbi:MAG: Fe-S cluster assembly protein SufD [Verrucomicrobiota bacterium]|jgi:Fe-S cluster assembly protein SufD